MNTTPGNEPTDEQLDAMLRDVQIPSDLKPRLKQIPASLTAAEEGGPLPRTIPLPQTILPAQALPTHASSAQAPWLSYVLVASLLAVATFATARLLTKNNNGIGPDSVATTAIQDHETEREVGPIDPMINKSSSDSDKQEQDLQMLQAEIQELELARLESELFRLEELNSTRLSQDEVESMILALAPEHSVALGGNKAYVRSEMARVQTEYPNTRGAVLADKILQEIN